MHTTRHQARSWSSAASPAAILVAVVALVLVAAGAGWSAAKIGTKDIQNNAVISSKVKNGTLTRADLVREKKFTRISAPGAPNFSNGGEGDCVWLDANVEVPGLAAPSFRIDRFGTVHLAGVVIPQDGPGGDGACDSSAVGESEDGIMMVLPRSLQPARTQLVLQGSSGLGLVIAGPNGLVAGSLVLPPGGVYTTSAAVLDGITYLPVGSGLSARTTTRSHVGPAGRALLRQILG